MFNFSSLFKKSVFVLFFGGSLFQCEKDAVVTAEEEVAVVIAQAVDSLSVEQDAVVQEKVVDSTASLQKVSVSKPKKKTQEVSNSEKPVKEKAATMDVEDEVSSKSKFVVADINAEPVGGIVAFRKMFISRVRVPYVKPGVKSLRVVVKFIVEEDGSLSNFVVLRDPGYGAGKEIVRVLQQMPKWEPAVKDNEKVRSQFILPVVVQVEE